MDVFTYQTGARITMNKIKLALLGLALGSTVAVAGECVSPEQPGMPEGAAATMEQMLAGQKAVKEFQAANLEYMGCLEPQLNAARDAAAAGSKEDEATYQKLEESYNGAVSKEEEVAAQFNTAIRAYKAANPG